MNIQIEVMSNSMRPFGNWCDLGQSSESLWLELSNLTCNIKCHIFLIILLNNFTLNIIKIYNAKRTWPFHYVTQTYIHIHWIKNLKTCTISTCGKWCHIWQVKGGNLFVFVLNWRSAFQFIIIYSEFFRYPLPLNLIEYEIRSSLVRVGFLHSRTRDTRQPSPLLLMIPPIATVEFTSSCKL